MRTMVILSVLSLLLTISGPIHLLFDILAALLFGILAAMLF